MEEKKKSNKIMFIILGIVIVALIGIVVFLVLKLNNNNTNNQIENSSNSPITNNSKTTQQAKNMSFKLMDTTDTSLTDNQKDVIKFFDEDYFFLYTYTELVRYADMLKNINVALYCQINSILSSDSENFEAVCQWGVGVDDFYGGELADLTEPIIIKGRKPEKMVMQKDVMALKGKLIGAETRNINGQNIYLPIIEITEMGENSNWYSEVTLRNVSKAVFGNDVKFRKPTNDEMLKMTECDYISFEDWIWLAEFENQSNLNFKVFDIWQSNPYGLITYNYTYNQGIEHDYYNKQLYVTPDLQKYIVFDMSRKDKYVYINVYDRKLNKLWQKEISNASQITWDTTNSNLVFVSDNDFYNINIETGENIFDPVFVGKKNDVRILNNGYLLINNDTDDNIMFLDTNGKIKNKFDIKLGTKEHPNPTIYSNFCQKIDDNYVILYNLYDKDKYNDTNAHYTSQDIFSTKYIIINGNGEKIKESE